MEKHLDIPSVNVRDPFILVAEGKYFLYSNKMYDKPENAGVYYQESTDLINWSEHKLCLSGKEAKNPEKNVFWAPECHYYKGNYYIITSVFSSVLQHRCISIYKADNPRGPFKDICNGCITPTDWDAIDGTLFIDKNGDPYMVFVHEWTSMPGHNGSMVYAKLSDDLTHFVTEPQHMFYAKDPVWAITGVTDGPFLFYNKKGELKMLWSNFCKDDYAVAIADSQSNTLAGPWAQRDMPIYYRGKKPSYIYDGGHPMMFTDLDGNKRITFHTPNKPYRVSEHLAIFDYDELLDE
jgi:beta-xylosidase